MANIEDGPNPSGLCMCGCGEPTPIARQNDKRYGIIKDLPQRYVKGHQRFKSKSGIRYLEDEDGCWIWQRAVNSAGYGHLYRDGVHRYAHVDAYEQTNGVSVAATMDVHHTCGKKLCVNPDHLELHRRDTHRLEHAIITTGRAEYIRDAYATGVPITTLAASFGISEGYAENIARDWIPSRR